MTTTDLPNRPTVADGHLFVDHLVEQGMPAPDRCKVRDDLGELTLSLSFATDAGWSAWADHLDTVGAVSDGPWRIGPTSVRVAVGRVRGVRTVLALEVDVVDEIAAATNAASDLIPPGPDADPPTPLLDVLGKPSPSDERAGSPPAPAPVVVAQPAPEVDAETTGPHDVCGYWAALDAARAARAGERT